jgi:YD repeat-containing protein
VHSRLLAADGGVQSLRADGSVLRSTRKPHPRLGLFSPLQDRTLTLPSGLVIQTIEEATVSGSDLAQPVDEVRRTQVNGRTTTWHYSAATREHRITSPAGRSQAWREDAAGRVVQREVGGLAAIHYAYDDQGRVVLQTQGSGNDARRTQFFYGNDGLLSGITDALGRSLSLQRDAAGRVVQGLLPGARTIGFVQDPNGNLVSLTPPGRPAHTIGYDRRDLETHYTPPLLAGVASPQHTKVYNLDKDLTLWTLADGRSLSLGYDASQWPAAHADAGHRRRTTRDAELPPQRPAGQRQHAGAGPGLQLRRPAAAARRLQRCRFRPACRGATTPTHAWPS